MNVSLCKSLVCDGFASEKYKQKQFQNLICLTLRQFYLKPEDSDGNTVFVGKAIKPFNGGCAV